MHTYVFKALGIRTIDGDTIVCELDHGFNMRSTQYLRLWGVNTPEKNSTNINEKQRAYEATEFTASFTDGRDILVQTYKSESFGRYLAKVFIPQGDGEYLCLNDMLIAEGLAEPFMTNTDLL